MEKFRLKFKKENRPFNSVTPNLWLRHLYFSK